MGKRTPRAVIATVLFVLVAGLGTVACVPSSSPSGGCYGYVSAAGEHVDSIIRRLWADDLATADWLIRTVAPRESGCDPCASNPRSHDCGRVFDLRYHAFGTLQYLSTNAYTALKSACPLILPERSWRYAECNLKLARWKYDDARRAGGSGHEPWQ